MSCKNQKKKSEKPKFDINSISGVLQTLMAIFLTKQTPHQALPPALLLIGLPMKPGLSADAITARMIVDRQAAGIPTGDIFADGPNKDELGIKIGNDNIVSALHNDAVINGVVNPGSINVSTIGVGNMGAPVSSQGSNINIVSLKGAIV